MQNILDIVLLIPVLAFVAATINTILIVRAFRDKPWGMKAWLVLGIGAWIPWSGFTVLMRLAGSQNEALWYLRFSFISLQLASYALYRFHHLLVFRSEDARLATYGMAIIVGSNIAMSFNPTMLNAIRTENGDYYTDQFHVVLLLLNLILNFSAAFWSIRGLRRLELMSASFYTETGQRQLGRILFSLAIMGALLLILLWWIISGDDSGVAPDVTGFILMSIFVTSFLGITYGLRPVSDILVPQRIWSFLVISDTGLPLYERDFSKVEQIGDLILFAGALTSVNTVFMAQLKSETPLQLIRMEDRATMIKVEDDLMFCLVADHDTLQLEIALDEIVSRVKAHPNFARLKLNSQPETKFIDGIIDEIFKSAPTATQAFPQMVRELETEPEAAALNFESALPPPTTLVSFERLNVDTPEPKSDKEETQ